MFLWSDVVNESDSTLVFCFVSKFTRIIELFCFEVDDNETGMPSLSFINSDEFTLQLIAV